MKNNLLDFLPNNVAYTTVLYIPNVFVKFNKFCPKIYKGEIYIAQRKICLLLERFWRTYDSNEQGTCFESCSSRKWYFNPQCCQNAYLALLANPGLVPQGETRSKHNPLPRRAKPDLFSRLKGILGFHEREGGGVSWTGQKTMLIFLDTNLSCLTQPPARRLAANLQINKKNIEIERLIAYFVCFVGHFILKL